MLENKCKILFVCLGNICRSPMAETIMKSLVEKHATKLQFHIDSAGIASYHAGEKADSRMRMHAEKRGYKITHISRPIRPFDFEDFDMIISMDDSVHDSLLDIATTIEEESKISRMTDYCVNTIADHVPDPYYGGSAGFERVIDILEDSCMGLLHHICGKHK